ncbi:MAG: hypothetical protein AB8H80_10555 [Planctomycetota bacterium]
MSTAETIPESWADKIDDLVSRDQAPKAIVLLEQWMTQYAITPWAVRRLGELHLASGDRVAAGRAFFWSGERGNPEHASCIHAFLKKRRRHPRRIVSTLPPRARATLENLPGALPGELRALGVTDTVVVKGNREWPMWVQLSLVAVFAAIFIVGLVTSLRWVAGMVRGLF